MLKMTGQKGRLPNGSIKIQSETQNGVDGFSVDGELKGNPSEIIEELAYGIHDVLSRLPGGCPANAGKFVAELTVLVLHDKLK